MKTLILVDIQNDFLPGGTLAVPKGDEVIEVVNSIEDKFDLILATKDWHPENHVSFAKTHGKQPGEKIEVYGQIQHLWPVHCVQNSLGAEFGKSLKTERIEKVFYKGTDPLVDSYSTFFDNAHLHSTGLEKYLKEKNIKEIYVAGLAIDYCVKHSVLDARSLGFQTYVILDACRGIDISPQDISKAVEEMEKAGAKIIFSKDLR